MKKIFLFNQIAIVTLVLVFSVLPILATYLRNVELGFGVSTLFIESGYIALILILYLALSLVSLCFRKSPLFLSLAFGLALLSILQSQLLISNYGVVDGSEFDFSGKSNRIIIEAVIWLSVILFFIYKRKWVKANLFYLAPALLVWASAPIFMHFLNSQSTSEESATATPELNQYTSSKHSIFRFSKENKNIVIWISDGLQGDITQEILSDNSNPDFYDGFTFYDNAMGHYRYTLFAVPSIFSGLLYEGTEEIAEYRKRIKSNNLGVWGRAANYVSDMVSTPDICLGFKRCNYYWLHAKSKRKNKEAIQNTINASLFKVVPHVVKSPVFDGIEGAYNDNAMRAFTKLLGQPDISTSTGAAGDTHFFTNYTSRLKADFKRSTLKILHSRTPHHPYVLDGDCNYAGNRTTREAVKEQAACQVKTFEAFLLKLKEIGVYDNTAIFWVSDHGARQKYARIVEGETGDIISDSAITFVFKPINAKGSMKIDNRPIQLSDLAPTVIDIMAIEATGFPGQSLMSKSNGDARIRPYYDSTAMTKNSDITFQKYMVRGDFKNPENWEKTESFKSKLE